jgi:hypothetical protein
MAWEILAGAGISAIGGLLGSNSAADAQEEAAKRALREQQRGLGIQLGLNEPQRYTGYQALGDISAEFGYDMAPWASASQLNEPTMDASAFIKALESGMSFDEINQLGRLGALNPREIEKLNKYLTPEQIQQLSAVPGSTGSGGTAPTGRGFTASPDYQFRRDEGVRDLGNSFAARGGAFSGNALRALTQFNSGLASGEYGNWFNRRAQLAGLGGQATQNAQGAVQNTTNNISGLTQAQGDARASGILGGYNSVANSVNNGLGLWMLNKGGYFGGGSSFNPSSAQNMVNTGLANWSNNWTP